jgi:hypothetical protein
MAGRIYDGLRQEFGRRNLFFDFDSIALGENFLDRIEWALRRCDVCLPIIGPKWLTLHDASGVPRLQKPDDPVRLEVETALDQGVRVIPLLVDGGTMPKPGDLPPSLAALCAMNGTPVRHDPDFDADLRKVIRAIDARRWARYCGRALLVIAALALIVTAVPGLWGTLAGSAREVLFGSPPLRVMVGAVPDVIRKGKTVVVEPSDGPAIPVRQDIRVEPGGTLVLKAGTTLAFDPEVGVSCAGELRAEGTEKARVTFKAADPERGWAHVLLADGQGTFDYCTFEDARGAKHDTQPEGSATPKLDEIYDGQTRFGGAVLAYGDQLAVFKNCLFRNNRANRGGAVCAHYLRVLTVSFCEFTDNATEGGETGGGGAIYAKGVKQFQLRDSQLTGNAARGKYASGGALYVREGENHLITNCTFRANAAAYIGGALYSLQIVREGEQRPPDMPRQLFEFRICDFLDNTAHNGGGTLFFDEGAEVWLMRCRVEGDNGVGDPVKGLEWFGKAAVALYSKHSVNKATLRLQGTTMPPKSIAMYKDGGEYFGPAEYLFDMQYQAGD